MFKKVMTLSLGTVLATSLVTQAFATDATNNCSVDFHLSQQPASINGVAFYIQNVQTNAIESAFISNATQSAHVDLPCKDNNQADIHYAISATMHYVGSQHNKSLTLVGKYPFKGNHGSDGFIISHHIDAIFPTDFEIVTNSSS